MVSICKLGTACLVCVLSGMVGLNAGEEGRASDHAALRALREKVTVALNMQDVPTLTACLAKTFTMTTVDQSTATRPEQVQALFDRMFKGPGAILTSLKADPQADGLTRFLDDHTGIVEGSSRDVYVLRTGNTMVLTSRWTATVVKEDGAWKIAAAHVGIDPLDNPILRIAGSFWRKACLVGTLGGLLLGAFLGRFLSRRRAA